MAYGHGHGASEKQSHLQVVQAQRDVLSIVSIEDPDFSVGRGFWHPVSVVVEENPLLPGVASETGGQATNLLQGRVQGQAVPAWGNVAISQQSSIWRMLEMFI